MEITRGQDESYALLIADVNGALDLDTALEIELVVKQSPGDDDPGLLSLKLTDDEIVARSPQSGATKGYCDIAVTSAQSFALPARTLYGDVWVTNGSGQRRIAITLTIPVTDVCGFPP